ncbi:MAG: hypothetical protein WC532_07325 [Candidatus Omnitrophota bacterium]
MYRKFSFMVLVITGIFLFSAVDRGLCDDVREEREEKTLEISKLEKKKPTFKLSSVAGLFYGFDTNARLSAESKGDHYEEFLWSSSVIKPWIARTKFVFNYDLDVLNYNEATDISNILNHGRFVVDKKLFDWLNVGIGDDLAIYAYTNNDDGTFLFNKYLFYLKSKLARKTYHQLLFSYGEKYYTDRKAMGDDYGSTQEKERRENRQSVEYNISSDITRKFYAKIMGRFSVNNSNDRYLDFYDYKSYEISPSITYKFTRKFDLSSNFIYLRKNYKSRLVTNENYKEKENIYATNLLFRYKLDKHNILSFLYTYRGDNANDSIDKYTENVFTCGWQYNF